jgi:universal stress protein E
VDLSEPSVTAARWTAAYLGDADIVLLHVVDVPEPPSFLRGLYPPTQQLIENARRGAETRLRELTTSLRPRRVFSEVRVGRAGDVLTSVAGEISAKLLVVGLHGERSGIWKMLGSTAERVARSAPTSVLLGRRLPTDGPRRVLVAIDDSPATSKVIEWGGRLAGAGAENAIVMHVANPLLLEGRKTDREQAEKEGRRLTEQWMGARLAGTALEQATVHADFGDPGFQILAAIDREGADMLVVGRHDSATKGVGFMGSVVEFLLRNGEGPVLVVAP